MNTHNFRLLVIWNVVLTVLLIIALAFVAVSVQAASDPPVKVYSAVFDHSVAGTGMGRVSDVTIAGTAYQPILSIPVNFTGQSHNHYCLAVGSANAINPASGGHTGYRYNFSMSRDGSSSSFTTMVLEFSDNPSHDDANYAPVTTNAFWTSLSPAAHTFEFVAREQDAANPNLTIDNAFMSVICIKKLQESGGTVSDPISEEPAPEQLAPNDQ